MSVLEVVHYGDPILRKKCNSVKDFSKLESLLNDMFDLLIAITIPDSLLSKVVIADLTSSIDISKNMSSI